MDVQPKKKIAIFASGKGSNAACILAYFHNHPTIEVAVVISNSATAGVLAVAEQYHVPSVFISKQSFAAADFDLYAYFPFQLDLIVLAGFLLLVPKSLIERYPHRIVNIHPALLPKFGGKGMYGRHVHEAVLAAKESQSGMTIHEVDAVYDEGRIIAQYTCEIAATDTAADLAKKVLALEHLHYAPTIEKLLQ